MKNIYTDLALEEREKFNRDIQIEGVESYQKKENSVNMLTTVVKIVNEKGKETMGKPIGSYITMESPKIRYSKEAYRRELGKFLCNYLKEITSKENIKSILIVGLGNSMATPDALGPKTARDIICTKNIYCMAPGVLSQTGMETYDIIKGVVSQIDPDLIIAIDSLAARNVRRITTTIQITNTGITPGSGIGNHRKGLNEESLGKKVIAIGVPMVVSGATIVNDTMENLIRILSKIENNKINVLYITKGNSLKIGNVKFTCLSPGTEYINDDRNDYSTVLRLEYHQFSMVFTGDISGEIEEKILEDKLVVNNIRACVALKVAHHGSKYSTTDRWLEKIKPTYSFISVGKNNMYGHPTQETLDRLEQVTSKIFRTDYSGEVDIISDGKEINIIENIKNTDK